MFEMPRGKVGRFARFAPDGRSLALQIAPADGTSNGSLVRMDTCTGALASLVDDAPQQSAPVYSPDGNQIYYTWGHTPSDSSIRVMGSFGGNVAVVLDVFGAMMPEVSPDGSTLVYRINGGNLQLYGLAGGNDPNELPFSGYSARFSPDGARLVFTEPAGGAMHVIVYDLRTGTTFQLATVDVSTGYFAGVDFAANGTAVVVTSDVGTELIGINGGRRPLDSATGWVDVSADDRSVALLDHDRLVLLRDAI